jgi:hypothetical protein
MNAVKARVVNGRLVIEEPTDLPEGTELYLMPVGEDDEERMDIAEANDVLEAMQASGEKPIPLTDIKVEFAL